MNTIDFKKDPIYKAGTEPEIINVPEIQFLMVDGEGAPDSSDSASTAFQDAMQIIFGVVYAIKFWDKKHPTPSGYAKFTMPPIEALWWTKSGRDFDLDNPDDWMWTALHRLPDFVTPQFLQEVTDELIDKKQSNVFKKARLEYFTEGTVTQIMHIGPYNQEEPNIKKMHAFAREKGYELTGKHHELYFGDPRRTAPEKLRTILRQPIKETRG